ncbi:iron-containing alcohol dehydrogenase [Thalassotalea sp. 1_MG-2023]|uniref:iron-containing alcohol dehydrogenase n=1 Tax=Thalassotalea sp. 1_MG-2023 TaxID=3062680 RepID=UPI0026E25F8E|nr:iron-containing alcohol dehydrogenase [Thalassotalea sp. 1_MG-2023]MDO6427406.1 iron-containing alcohol dehydrogenase [Thalassotalea sp. 1_MG-2023]
MNPWLHHFIIFIRKYANKLIRIPLPALVTGSNHLDDVPELLQRHEKSCVFIATDNGLMQLGLIKPLLKLLDAKGIKYHVFDQITPDPSIEIVEQGKRSFIEHQCDAIIAFGGGSVIDCAKGVAASVVKNKSIAALSGLFRVRKKLPYFIAIPTTAGTGSETTLVAVVTDVAKQQKFTVIDPCLVPAVALLDPVLTIGLPKQITAETGVDALTHAIESYLSKHATRLTKYYSLQALKGIFTSLPLAYENGTNETARHEMLLASYYAGAAFTRASIGYVHAIAHQLGAVYHIPHGRANAVLLPHVLEFSKHKSIEKYAELAVSLGFCEKSESNKFQADTFLTRVNSLLRHLNIPTYFEQLRTKDIPLLANRAIKEAYCDYPVPTLMSVMECQAILHKLCKNNPV